MLEKFFVVDNSQNEFDFDVESAQRLYEECFVPLLYHELWESIRPVKNSTSREALLSTGSGIEIQITRYVPQVIDAANLPGFSTGAMLMYGSYSFQIDLLFNRTFPRLAVCDIVLIHIGTPDKYRSFFAIVVHVADQWPPYIANVTSLSGKWCQKDEKTFSSQG